MFDFVIKDGILVDPSQGINSKMDVGFYAGRITAVEKNIEAKPGKEAKFVIDASERIVTPGLIDLHVHLFQNPLGLRPEALITTGTTTAVDAGTIGTISFSSKIHSGSDCSLLRIYNFLNISALGITDRPELEDITYGNVDKTVHVCKENRALVKGIKVRLTKNALKTSNPRDAFRLAREAADDANVPLMVHATRTNEKSLFKELMLPDILKEMKRGDILTHMFAHYSGIVEDDHIIPEVLEASKRGVVFDLGHGIGSFSFDVARKSLEQGVIPDTISTDLHRASYMGPAFDLPTTMSKLMHLGLSLDEVVQKATVNPARTLGINSSLGTLKIGSIADATIFELKKGEFVFTDTQGRKETGHLRLVPKAVFHAGDIGIAGTWSQVNWKAYKPKWV